MPAVSSVVMSLALVAAGVAFYSAGSTVEGSIFFCAGMLGCILIMMTYYIVSSIRENNKKKESS